jgi:uncharacterized protein (DUF1810 family)
METVDLNRFVLAQEKQYEIALFEIKNGKKQSHWMWYIFPQLAGLGRSGTAMLYGIKNLEEATSYLQHSLLGKRLEEISNVLLQLPGNNAHSVFGSPDDLKLRSCMTLFSEVPGASAVFENVINKFFQGIKDPMTLGLLRANDSYE